MDLSIEQTRAMIAMESLWSDKNGFTWLFIGRFSANL
jgi:hypothetical protein